MIELTVNGKTVELDGPIPLTEYLESLGVNIQRVAVALNSTVLQKSRYDEVTLNDGDVVEVVRPVGGG
jgi:sulfur carrier protein